MRFVAHMVVAGPMEPLQTVVVQRPYVERKEADGSVQIVEAQSVVKKPVVGQWFVAAQSVGEPVVEPFVGQAAAGIVVEMGRFVG